jgi:phosphoribosylglycinamide formyltransferase 2
MKIMLLGSGELGKELTISLKRLGHYVIACDNYNKAPAMQVADERDVFDMLDATLLKQRIEFFKPDYIVPEVEAIRTETLLEAEKNGYTVVPSARAVNLTMNRDRIRDRASELGLRTAKFEYAENLDELKISAKNIGLPVVVKPVMSSSGKGQSICKKIGDANKCWEYAISNMRGDRQRVIVEEFIEFDYEITLLTIRDKKGYTEFCPPIGHVQERGDYQYSWQPHEMSDSLLKDAKEMAKTITEDLGGAGIFGVEFFVRGDEVIFSELSPRPHDTGMVTLLTQNLSEFDLHARAFLGLPWPNIKLTQPEGASHVVLSKIECEDFEIKGVDRALEIADDVRVFGKPTTRKNRRMAVVLARNVGVAKTAAEHIKIKERKNK